MSTFIKFKEAVQKQFQKMVTQTDVLFLTNIKKDVLWDNYLNSYPEGTNNIYRERREYDCAACMQFVRPFGNIVAIIDNQLVSIWDIENLPEPYATVAKHMSTFVKRHTIINKFIHDAAKLGIDKNHEELPSGEICTWEHFYFKLPKSFVYAGSKSIDEVKGEARTTKQVFKRALTEISIDAMETVLDLIEQNSLYRGEEYKVVLNNLLIEKKDFDKIPKKNQNNYVWLRSTQVNSVISRLRNSAIGTLLVDLSEERDLNEAVSAFEKIMAPTNYKRPKALFTKKMIADAEITVKELDLEDSLGRRYSELEDITINNVLWANRLAKKTMGAFEELKETVAVNPKNFTRVEEINIQDFIKNVLPKTESVEILLENKHTSNLVSLISPKELNSKSLFKWDNGFSWAYTGDITDSIKEKVKRAGGSVDGALRVSLSWFNADDLDISVIESKGTHINYGNRQSSSSKGTLDVDMNAGTVDNKIDPVENIVWPDINYILECSYSVRVHNFTSRSYENPGFEIEIESGDQIFHYTYTSPVRGSEKIEVATFNFTKTGGIEMISDLKESNPRSKEVWGLHTNNFQKVNAIMYSPNCWDGKQIGNRHFFFMIDGAKNEDTPRGFFNEFLREDLNKHKRVFEALGGKMKVAPSDKQLSGLGFSSTKKDSVIVKVTGSFERLLKINF